MNKIRVVIAVIVTSVLIAAPLGCFGVTNTKDYSFGDFTRINVSSAFEVEITQSSSYSISITGDNDKIEVTKVGDRLNIRIKPNSGSLRTPKAEITMPDITSLALSGASKGTIHGFSFTHEFSLSLSGASKLTGDLDAGDVTFALSGASTVELQGLASDMAVTAGGDSHVKLSGFEVDNADVMFSGASDGTVKVDGRPDANLSGASKLTVDGNPTMGDINISGGSTID